MVAALFDDFMAQVRADRPVVLVTQIRGPHVGAKLLIGSERVVGSLGDAELDRVAAGDARRMLEWGRTGTRSYGASGENRMEVVELFFHSFAAAPRMYIFGAIDFAAATARIGKFLGYHVTVCDARATFLTPQRFPEADELIVQWPHEFLPEAFIDSRTVICALTHDPRFDVPLLKAALETPAGYIGAMGSRRTDAERRKALAGSGVPDAELSRIAGPIGLDIGANTPEEVAISIAAEIIARRTSSSGRSLDSMEGPIHR